MIQLRFVRRQFLFVVCLIAEFLGTVSPVQAQFDATAPQPISRLQGALVLHGGGPVATEVRARFVELAGGAKAKIVVISAADAAIVSDETQLAVWGKTAPASVELIRAETREQALRPEFAAPLAAATGAWFRGGKSATLAATCLDTPLGEAVKALLNRGGVAGGTAAGAALAGATMLVDGAERRGFDLLPGGIVDRQFANQDGQDRLLKFLAARPDRMAFGIDDHTALVVRGRSLEVIGESEVVVGVGPSSTRPLRIDLLSAARKGDLVALGRAAQARSQPPFPPAVPPVPCVENGSLVIVGGGGMPKGLLEKFIELAGGPDAPLVYIPCTEREVVLKDGFVEVLRKAGAKHVVLLHTKDRHKAAHDDEFLAPLKAARGVWFGGGRQWNLVDSYQNTTAHKLMHEVLARGGTIGGSSAGASIQGDYMPRGDPLGNFNIIAEGYERGLGFLTGVAIDQHFAQRKRFADMASLVRTYPQLLGIGIDEGTALIVRKHTAEIVGKGHVAFYNAREQKVAGDMSYVSVRDGQQYDLQARRIVD